MQNQSGDMENLLPRYREASENSKIASGSFSDGINGYSHFARSKFTETSSVKNSSSCGWKPHPFSVPGMSRILCLSDPFVSSCPFA